MLKLWRVAFVVAGGLVAFAASTSSNQSIDRYLDSLQDVKTEPASKTVISSSAPQSNGLGDDRYTYTIENVREQGSMQQLAAFGTNSDVLWPGSIIQGSSLVSNQLAPITVAHGPETITVTAFVPGVVPSSPAVVESVGAAVSTPTLLTVTNAVNAIVFPHPGAHQPGSMSYSSEEVYSKEQAAIAMSANYSFLGGDISTYLNSQDYSSRSHVLVQFVQKYYTVAVSPPSFPSSFFDHHVTLAQVKSQTSQANGPNPAVYVSGVDYGRIAYLFLSSTENVSKLKAAVDASISGLLASGKLSGSVEQQKVLTSADARIFVLGGDATAGAKLVANKLGGMAEWLTTGGTFSKDSPGAPISFVTRYLRSDYRVAGAAFVTDYSKPDIRKTPERFLSVSRSYKIDDDKDKGNGHRFLVYQGSVLLNAENWTGDDIVWRTSGTTYDSGPIPIDVPVSECSSLRFRTEQRGHDGKTTGWATINAVTDAGRTITLVRDARFEIENTGSVDYTPTCAIP